jgi:hypothetical protein
VTQDCKIQNASCEEGGKVKIRIRVEKDMKREERGAGEKRNM